MARRDRLGAWLLVILLWLTILAVLLLVWPHVPDRNVRIVLVVGALAVLVFNTASIAAMLKHYAADRQFIYGLDIKALDAMKSRK